MSGILGPNDIPCPYCGAKMWYDLDTSDVYTTGREDRDIIISCDWHCPGCGKTFEGGGIHGTFDWCRVDDGDEEEEWFFDFVDVDGSPSRKAPARKKSPAAGKPSTKRKAPAKRRTTSTKKLATKRRTASTTRRARR